MTKDSRRRVWRERYLEQVLADLPRGRLSNAAVADLVRTTWDTAFIEGHRDGADAAHHFKAERDRLLAFGPPPDGGTDGPKPLDWFMGLGGMRRLLGEAHRILRDGPGQWELRRKNCRTVLDDIARADELAEKMCSAAATAWVGDASEASS